MPDFAINKYLLAAGRPDPGPISRGAAGVSEVDGSPRQDQLPDDWKTYLRWHTLHYAAPMLSSAFVNEDFDFYGRTLTGAKEIKPRWKRVIGVINSGINGGAFPTGGVGEALGQLSTWKSIPCRKPRSGLSS